MSHRSFSSTLRAFARAAAQAERPRRRAQSQAEAAAKRALRDAERQAKADAKEAAQDHLAEQIEEAEMLSEEVHEREQAVETLLARALTMNPAIDLQARMKTFIPAKFDEQGWPSDPPQKVGGAPAPEGAGRARGGAA